jgi:hypothetical protein
MLTFPDVGLAIDLQFKDPEIRALFYDQFEEFAKMLEGYWGKPPEFIRDIELDSGVVVSRITIVLPGAYFYDRAQWPEILNWYEEKMVAFDEFWEMAGDVIKGLAR